MEAKLKGLLGGRALEGLDRKRPWGLVVLTDGQQKFPTYAFLPVTDLKKLLATFKKINIGSKDLGDGLFRLTVFGPNLYVKQKKGWAFFSGQRETLAKLPDDPVAMLGGLEKKYDLAVRVSPKNIPEMFRRMFVGQLPMIARHGMRQAFDESDEQFQFRVNLTKILLRPFVAVAKDVEEFSVGLLVDRHGDASFVDVDVTARAGTKTAARLSRLGPAKTVLAGFDLPDAAISGNFAATLTDRQVEDAKTAIAGIRAKARENLKKENLSEAELGAVGKLIDDLLEVARKTIETKRIEGGIAAILNPGAVTFVAGCSVADGAKVEQVLRQLADLTNKEDPKYAKMLKIGAETFQGVRFHLVSMPTEQYDTSGELLAELFGEKLEVVVGIGPRSVYLAAGRGGAAMLKRVISQSKAAAGKTVPSLRIALSAVRLARFAAYMSVDEQAEQAASVMAALLGQSGGKDHVILTCRPAARGARFRLEIEQGLLRGLGVFGKLLISGAPLPRPVPGGGLF